MNFLLLRSTRVLIAAAALSSASLWSQASLPDLPVSGGRVYVVEGNGSPVKVHAAETKFNTHAGSNFARSFFYAGPVHSLDIEGVAAELQLQSHTPVFYVRIPSDEDPDIFRKRITLMRVIPEKKTRSVMDFSANAFGGHHKRLVDEVSVTKIDTTSPGWLQIAPTAPLDPDDYAIAYLPADSYQAPTEVYDFAVAGKRKPKPDADK